MTLQEFLRTSHPFEWGGVNGDDCTTFCASWIESQIGIDPAANLRGRYHDSEGAHALIDDAGDLVAFMGVHLEPLGYVRTDVPHDGDVGVVRTMIGLDGEMGEVGAIRYGPLWAILSVAGVRAKKIDFIAAWRLPA